jgi:hypothetical protein
LFHFVPSECANNLHNNSVNALLQVEVISVCGATQATGRISIDGVAAAQAVAAFTFARTHYKFMHTAMRVYMAKYVQKVAA